MVISMRIVRDVCGIMNRENVLEIRKVIRVEVNVWKGSKVRCSECGESWLEEKELVMYEVKDIELE